MGMFDDLTGGSTLEVIAARMGVTAEAMQALLNEIGRKIAAGETDVAALASTAAEHGVSADQLQELFAHLGGPEAMLNRMSSFFDRDGDGNPLNELSRLAKGIFG